MVQIIRDSQPLSPEFVSPSQGEMSMSQVLSEISLFVDEDPSSYYTLIIGTDSQTRHVNSHAEIDFVTAIIIYRKKKGARYFLRRERHHKKPILRDKIYTETLMSLDMAKHIVPEIRKRIPSQKYDLEIHIDVGTVGPTREMIKEVVGMVTGSGYIAKTKPESWGASSVADKHT